MPRKPESPGTCAYCGETIAKRSIKRHLEKCRELLGMCEYTSTAEPPY